MTQKKLRTLRKEFADHGRSALHSDYDRGYFQALESYVRKLEHSDVSQLDPVQSNKKPKQ
jgi:hypothetical protein